MFKRSILWAILLIALGAVAEAQTCDVTHVVNVPDENAFWSELIYDSGNWLYVAGPNFVASINNSNPATPSIQGNTTDYTFTCGDIGAVVMGTDMFPGDTAIFVSTLCHGLRSYDISNSKINPSPKSYVDFNSAKPIAALKTASGRYIVWPGSGGLIYADFTDMGGSGTAKPIEVSTAITTAIADHMQGFEWGGRYYLAMHSRLNGLSVWDVTNFPNSATLKIANSALVSFHGHHYNGRFYVTGESGRNRDYGLFIFELPSGNLLSAPYTGRGSEEFSDVRSLFVDDQYAYLGLGACDDSGGLDIVDISVPTAMYSVMPSDFVPRMCANSDIYDVYAKPGGTGAIYLFVAGHVTQDVYQVTNCGEHANVILQAASPSTVDPGGTYPVTVTLKNAGNLATSSVNATLSTTHGKVTVNAPATQSFGTLDPGASATKTYTINVASDATESTIPFHLSITSSTGSYSADFNIQINPPRPILNRTIRKSATSQALEVEYFNSGNADYSGTFTVTLENWTTEVTLSPAVQTFGPIAKGATQARTYPYTVGAGACTPLNFISVHVVNSDTTIGNDPADVSVDLVGSTGEHPFVKYSTSSLSKALGVYTLSLSLHNAGSALAQTLQTTLTAANVTWLAGNVMNFGDLAAGGTATRTLTFTVPDGVTEAVFSAKAASVQGCWSFTFSHSMLDVIFTYVDERHCSFANCMFPHPDIYEGTSSGASSTNFWFKLRNDGTSDASAVAATLTDRDGNPNVSISPPSSSYTIPAGTEAENNPAFVVGLTENYCSSGDSSCPALRLRLSIPSYGYEKDLQFTIKSTGGGTTYSLSGTVSGALTAGVTLNLSGAASKSTTTGSTGSYTFSGLANGAYTITPAPVTGYTFSPTSRSVTVNGGNQSGLNFTASSGATYSITGTVSGATASGVTMSLAGAASATATTDGAGNYTFSGLLNGNYIVTPSKAGYSFTPSSLSVTINNANQAGKNFTAAVSNVTLSYQASSVDDTTGDNDKILDPGETVLLYVTLKNDSTTAISNAAATLTTTSSGITISTQSSYTIQPMKTAAAFFTVAANSAYTGMTASFRIVVTGATVSNPEFTIPVGGAGVPLSYRSYAVDDGAEGDGILQPGETVKLNVYLRNDGTSAIVSAPGRLSTTVAGATVKSQGNFTLQPGETNYASFTVELSADYAEKTVPFAISVTGAAAVKDSPFVVAVGSAGGNAMVIPVVAHVQGAQGTNWKSDIQIHNDSDSTITLTLKLIRTGVLNDTPPQFVFDLAANQTRLFTDVLAHPQLTVFQGNAIGSILVEFTGGVPPSVTTRIYNDLGADGTYGQSATAVLVDSRTRGTSGTIPAQLFGLRKTAQYRTNLGLVNISASWNTLKIDLLDAAGNPVGDSITQTLAPYNMLQLNDILGLAGVSSYADGFMAQVSSNSSQDFVSYASIADSNTGDASYISDQISGFARALVPGVAHAAGDKGSFWKTDLAIFNPDDSIAVTLRLNYFRYGFDGVGATVRVGPIPPLGSRMLDDVLSEFAGLAENEAGFMTVEPENTVDKMPLVAARTYNYFDDPEKGPCTFGQYIPGADYSAGARNGQSMVIAGLSGGLEESDPFRMNLGLINADEDGEALATISMYDSAGVPLGSYAYFLPYKTMGLQLSTQNIFDLLQIDGPFQNATLVVQAGGDNLFIYASSVDNKTSDPIYLEPTLH